VGFFLVILLTFFLYVRKVIDYKKAAVNVLMLQKYITFVVTIRSLLRSKQKKIYVHKMLQEPINDDVVAKGRAT
jgi:hypothetical protein